MKRLSARAGVYVLVGHDLAGQFSASTLIVARSPRSGRSAIPQGEARCGPGVEACEVSGDG